MRALVLGFVAAAALGGGEVEAKGASPGWRPATMADADAIAARLGTKAEDRPPNPAYDVSADFDGDGRRDHARMMIDKAHRRLGVFVVRGGGGPPLLLQSEPLDRLIDLTLSVQAAGVYQTACGRGAGDDRAPCQPRLMSRHPFPVLTYYETSDIAFRWNGRRFVAVYLTD